MNVDRLIIRGDGVSFPRSNRVINSATIDVLDDNGFRIGYVVEVTEALNRQVVRVRHLNSLDAGRIAEQAPGVEDATLNISGYSLYDRSETDRGSLIHRMGGPLAAARSLLGQKVPFNLVQEEVHPASGEKCRTSWFGCWVTSYNRTRNINNVVSVDRLTAQPQVRG